MRELKQSTGANVMVFMTDSTDHITGKPSLTLTITASKDGGTFGSIVPTVTERSNGWYNLALTAAHTDTLGDLAVHITATGADPTDFVSRIITLDKAAAGGTVPIDQSQPLTDTKGATVGGALHGAWAAAFGKMVLDAANRVLNLFGIGSQSTPLQSFGLDSSTSPTTRTPQ